MTARTENTGTSAETPFWAAAFCANRAHLLALAARNLQPILLRRFAPEDVLSLTYAACLKRTDYLVSHPEVPLYFKFRTLLLQVVADLERKNLQAGARDLYKEVPVTDSPGNSTTNALHWDRFAADSPSPVSQVDRGERHRLLVAALHSLAENDRQILVLRHFDGLRNEECAEILKLTPKAASIRHVRALERLHRKLAELSCFRSATHPDGKRHAD